MILRATIDLPADPVILGCALEGMIEASREQLRRGEVGGLYDSGVRYAIDSPGHVRWQTATETHRRRTGDCKDLTVWRCAEQRERGIECRALVVPQSENLWHVIVLYPDGTTEDPSVILGMNTPAIVTYKRRRYDMPPDATIVMQTPEQVEAALIAELQQPADQMAGDAVLEQAAADAGAQASASVAGADATAAIIATDANASAIEAAPMPVKPSVRWLATLRRDNTYDGQVAVRLADGREVRPVVHATTAAAAMHRAAELADGVLSRPEIAMLVPPQAVLAVKGILAIGHAKAVGKLEEIAQHATSHAMRALIEVFR